MTEGRRKMSLEAMLAGAMDRDLTFQTYVWRDPQTGNLLVRFTEHRLKFVACFMVTGNAAMPIDPIDPPEDA